MTPDREQPAQQQPDPTLDLSSFPARTLAAGSSWWRQHPRSAGPWWFSSAGTGRYDLAAPRGTCYLASSAAAAVRERIGPDLAAHRLVPASLLRDRVISRLSLPAPVRAANVDVAAATRFGVTSELQVMVPYRIPQAWAAALAAAAFAGLLARLRSSPGRSTGLALFGDAGERTDWATDPAPAHAIAVAEQLGLHAIDPPHLEQLAVIRPTLPVGNACRELLPQHIKTDHEAVFVVREQPLEIPALPPF